MAEKLTATQILLGAEPRKRSTDEFLLSSISKEFKQDFVVKIKSLGYDEAATARKHVGEEDIYIVMYGMLEPDAKNKELQLKYNAETPLDLIKRIYRPGEISAIARRIDILSEYRFGIVEDVKKN